MARRNVPSSRSSIERLRHAGYSDAEIGRAIGRDSSLIGQVRRGRKPGKNLAASLDALVSGRKVRKPARRKTARGGVAATRGSRGGTLRHVGAKEFKSRLEKIADMKGARVGFQLEWTNLDRQTYTLGHGWTALWGSTGHGTNPREILTRLNRYMRAHSGESDQQQLEGFLNAELRRAFPAGGRAPQFNSARGLTNVEYHVDVPTTGRKRGVRRMRPAATHASV
jgi:hypothetical protein